MSAMSEEALDSSTLTEVSPINAEGGVLLSPTSQAELEQQQAEWRTELARLEDEISTLRQVLASKVQQSHELKRKLGITVWREFQDDVSQGLKNVKETNVYTKLEETIAGVQQAVLSAPIYQKTESAIKATAEKTTSLLGGLGQKLGQLKNSESFRSLEERVNTTVTSVRTKIGTSRSNSMQGFDEALREHELAQAAKSTNGSAAVTPTSIPEDKTL